MKALSLFSGIGGIDLACEWAGIETVAFCEREPFPQKVLKKHWPDVPIYDDVCTLTKERLDADGIGTIDIIHGGYPCQPFSLAGDRKGAEDDRHLWPEVLRLIETIKPRWFVGENVAGHITLGLDDVLIDLGNLGYTVQPFVIPACAVNAPHRRDRVFIVAHSGSERRQQESRSSFGHESQNEGWSKKNDNKFECDGESDGTRFMADSHNAGMEGSQDAGSAESSWTECYEQSIGCSEGAGNWAVESRVGRVANGIPNRIHRLKALGNAVVPQQIYPILAAIKHIDDMMHTG